MPGSRISNKYGNYVDNYLQHMYGMEYYAGSLVEV